MLKVVRRDDYICQECHEHVKDDEIEFDHIIPFSKGGLNREVIRVFSIQYNTNFIGFL
jgi:5-methylcytosine-specific restriction endonuclease McrA